MKWKEKLEKGWCGIFGGGTNLGRTTAVVDVPCECSEFHGEHHLGPSDFDGFVALVVQCTNDVTGIRFSVGEILK
jgi:hypothetical protein